jgi:hypothetical protein
MFIARTLGEPPKASRYSGQLMTRVLANVTVGVVMLAGAQAIAADAVNHSTMGKRQMAVQVTNCMKKRMSANQDISYNAAAKVCKNQVNSRRNNSMAGALVASDSPAKP